ncbi:hypothetical protein Tco_0884358 [Tanacetum coccineum]
MLISNLNLTVDDFGLAVNKANGGRSACTRGPFAIPIIIIVKLRRGWLIEGRGRRSGVTTSSRAMILSSLSLLMSGEIELLEDSNIIEHVTKTLGNMVPITSQTEDIFLNNFFQRLQGWHKFTSENLMFMNINFFLMTDATDLTF